MKVIEPSFEIIGECPTGLQATKEWMEPLIRTCYKSEGKIGPGTADTLLKKIVDLGHGPAMEMSNKVFRSTNLGFPHNVKGMLENRFPSKYLNVVIGKKGVVYIGGSIRAWMDTTGMAMEDFYDNCPPGLVEVTDPEEIPKELRLYAVRFIVNRAFTHDIIRHRPCSFLMESQRYCRYSDKRFGDEITFIKPCFYEEDTKEYGTWEYTMRETEFSYFSLLKTSSPQAARTVLPNSCKAEIIIYCNMEEWKHIFKLRASPAADLPVQEIMIPLEKEMNRLYS